ncbi:MAG: type II secretion system F family protein [Methanoregulaceae archaeon]|nr:type II secretion system F family protein [Methanoregulaceae archaeon]
MEWIVVVAGGLVFVGVFLSGYALLMTRPNIEERLRGRTSVEQKRVDWLKYLRKSEKVLKPLGAMIPRSPEEMSRQERRLAQAGIRRKDAPFLLYGVKIVLAIVLFFLFTSLSGIRGNPVLLVLVPILLGAMIPDMVVTRLIQRRKENLQRALPDALDLAVVCVEAGLGLDQSLVRIGEELKAVYPPLSDELNLYSLEVNAGKKRSDALRNLGQRTEVDDLKSFAAVLIQTDRFGTSVAQALRVFADTMRTKRRQRAEEHAAKMSIKMIPPLVFFIFPAIFVVVLGPAIIAIVRYLLPGMAGTQTPQP